MVNIDQAHATSLLQYSLANGSGAPVPTVGNLHARLMTVNGTSTVLGTELPTSASYIAITGITPVTFAAAAAGAVANSITLTQVNMPACTIVGAELWDSSTVPHRLWFGALSASKTVNLGDTFTIAIGAMTLGIS
jgi:hypothetical protein